MRWSQVLFIGAVAATGISAFSAFATSPCCAVADDGSSCKQLLDPTRDPASTAFCVEVGDGTCGGGWLTGPGVPGCTCSDEVCNSPSPQACSNAAAAACCAGGGGNDCPGGRREGGYLRLSDGIELRYFVEFPPGAGPFPVVLTWTTYSEGVGVRQQPLVAAALVNHGYAVLGVNLRGTGCSGGQWQFFQPASDGYEVVEWAAAQPWSTGEVGMFGSSAPAIAAVLAAGTRPPHLRAIAASDVSIDFYRDSNYPGGIFDRTFQGAWALALRPVSSEVESTAEASQQEDAHCAELNTRRPQPSYGSDILQKVQRPYVDKWWSLHSPERVVPDVDVPVLTCQAWQDDQLTSRAGSSWLDLLDNRRTWAVFTNGFHGTCVVVSGRYVDRLLRFFDRFVKGEANGFETEDRIEIWHETALAAGSSTPAWVSTHPSWPVPVEPVYFYLLGGGRLERNPPDASGGEGEDAYAYPLPASSVESSGNTETTRAQATQLPPAGGWQFHSMPGGFVAYTTPPLPADLEVFGPASADLWLSSTAPDTDVQVTLTEVRADGQEMYVQRGWLRASHRRLDVVRSTVLRPFHTHLVHHAEPLTALEPTLLRVEIRPFGHVFRAGSSLRIYVEAPTGLTGFKGFDFLPTPARNAIVHDAAHPSRVVLGRVAGGTAGGRPLPSCGTSLSQPCRTNAIPVPQP